MGRENGRKGNQNTIPLPSWYILGDHLGFLINTDAMLHVTPTVSRTAEGDSLKRAVDFCERFEKNAFSAAPRTPASTIRKNY